MGLLTLEVRAIDNLGRPQFDNLSEERILVVSARLEILGTLLLQSYRAHSFCFQFSIDLQLYSLGSFKAINFRTLQSSLQIYSNPAH